MRRKPRRSPRRGPGLITVAAIVGPLALIASGTAAVAAPPHDNNAGGNQPPSHSQAPNGAPAVESHVKSVIKVNGRQFRDLNDNGKLDRYEDWRLSDQQRAADLLSRMTLEEKAGLMQIASLRDNAPELIEDRGLHHLIIRDNPTATELATRANGLQEIAEGTRLGIPLVFTSNPRNHVNPDLEFGISEAAGQFSSWPGTLGLAATNDIDLIRDFADIAQDEWRASGIQKTYGYQIETATEPRWRRINGTFGESPDLNAAIAEQLVLGFQGDELSNESVAQTIKHFPGDGAVLRGLDPHNEPGKWAIYPTPGSLETYQLPPFQAAIDAGASSVMSYYNVPSNALSAEQLDIADWYAPGQQFEEVAAAYNKAIVTDLLRTRMGFTGYVNSDSGILTNRAFGVENLTLPERFAKAVKAGTSLFSDNNDPAGLIAAVQTGLLTESELHPSVQLLLEEIFALGLFEDPYVDPALAQQIADDPASQARADEAHHKSIVLLRNDQQQLPLADADVATTKLFVEVVTGRDAEEQTAALKKLIAEEDPTVQVVNTLEEATDALVWVRPNVYEYPDNSTVEIQLGELTGVDVARVQQIEAAVPTILAINLGNPWVLNEIEPGAAAVIGTFNVKAEALLDVIRGRFNPTGELPVSIPASQAAVEQNASDVPGYAETFDYTYTNAAGDDYSFGFGLSYGN
ncbi:glycoside hydrolase family 3 N-terminal domain-containing protein [Salinibacterium sp. ZJ454]|uniref:glycoside hydrolase family 3 protein n=1 Tax=Salinibacterium sp. ZJ454 TaxID=2708339 RepID=UPI001423DB4B|nr:glycoside hydrolase family 3 N-terminal domain-containing protein [Salinibacterium sp. ZJ454]